MQLVHQYLLESGRRYPERRALISENREMTYSSLIANIHALGDVCIVEGMKKGDRVLILLHDKIEFTIAAYAVMRVGGIAVPITERTSLETVRFITKDCSPFAVITSHTDLIHYPLLRDKLSCHFLFIDETVQSKPHSLSVYSSSDHIESNESANHIAKLMGLTESDDALILYTANIDGHLRGAVFTHKSLIRSSLAINSLTGISHTLCECIMLPVSQSMGFGRLRNVLFAGGTAVLFQDQVSPTEQLIRHMLELSCTGISATQQFLASIQEFCDETFVQQIGKQIHFVEFGTASITAEEKKHITETFPGAHIYLHYGLTEVPRSTYMNFQPDRRRNQTVGRPAPYADIFIVDETGNRLGKGQAGQIVIRGEHGFSGYWHHHNGFSKPELPVPFNTGDIGFLDKEGFLCVLGRKDEIINMGGLKISPVEVEEKIREIYPDIEICVVGLPDPAGIVGEIPVLCCIADNGKKIISSELSSSLSNRLEKDKIPRIVYRVDRFPRINNVIARHELRKQLIEGTVQSIGHGIS